MSARRHQRNKRIRRLKAKELQAALMCNANALSLTGLLKLCADRSAPLNLEQLSIALREIMVELEAVETSLFQLEGEQ